MTDLNDVKAGEYELTALFWEQITSKPGEPFDFVRYAKGDKVKLNVEDARRLVTAGAVRKPGAEGGEPPVPGREESTAPEGSAAVGADAGANPPASYDPSASGETVDKVLAHVGDDQAEAARVLDLEKAGQNRTTLVEKLEQVANPPAS